ncbi:MAG: NADPH-dependent glutamate synthase [Clostridiales bacterium]|jgi:glutamate synthase (NADPH/NADH) small chain|nr:NADPH-dependent glutamate synthase [Clostridiales bacterium]
MVDKTERNMAPEKTKMPEQPPEERRRNFAEASLGYSETDALSEARRCLNCKHKPCAAGCPVNVRIPEFIEKIAEGDFAAAYNIIKTTNALPAVCGRVCPQENQCEKFCVRAKNGESVGIGRLERFAADWAAASGYSSHIDDNNEEPRKNASPSGRGLKAAVIGSGPAGLTCAGDLAAAGVSVTVFEAFHTAGGVLQYGIPEFRLPKAIVDKEINALKASGVEISLNTIIGRTLTLDDLRQEGFRAVFIGTGAGLPSFMGIEGEQLLGVYSANEYLTRVNLMKCYNPDYDTPIYKSRAAAVVGGGNVAMDAARCALRLGAERVYIVYRRGMGEIPARAEEIHHAREEGVIFKTLCAPVKILGDENGRVSAIECIEMELGEPDASGRARPVPKEGSGFVLELDTVIMAIGSSPNPLLKRTAEGLQTDRRGCIVTDEHGAASLPGVWAGGDAVSGAATVINAMGAGKTAARAIIKYLETSS